MIHLVNHTTSHTMSHSIHVVNVYILLLFLHSIQHGTRGPTRSNIYTQQWTDCLYSAVYYSKRISTCVITSPCYVTRRRGGSGEGAIGGNHPYSYPVQSKEVLLKCNIWYFIFNDITIRTRTVVYYRGCDLDDLLEPPLIRIAHHLDGDNARNISLYHMYLCPSIVPRYSSATDRVSNLLLSEILFLDYYVFINY